MKKLVLFISFCFLLIVANAQDRMTPELLWKINRVFEPLVSPDGKTVLFSVRSFDLSADRGNTDLFTISIAGGPVSQITNTPGSEFNPRWRPDGLKIGFLSAESGSAQLWEINPDGSEKRQVTNVDGGISNFNYAPTGNHIYFTRSIKVDKSPKDMYPDLPNANVRIYDDLMYRHWDSWADGTYDHVFFATYSDGKLIGEITNLTPNEPYNSPLKPFGGENQLAWSPDGKTIAYTSKKKKGKDYAFSTNSDIYLYNIETRSTANLTEGMKGYDVEPKFSPDGKYIAWLSMERDGFEADRNRIFVQNRLTGEKRELTAGFDQSSGALNWSKDSKTLFFESGTNATVQLYAYDFEPKRGQNNLRKITDGMHDFTSFDVSQDKKNLFLVATKMSMSHPIELYRVNAQTGEQTQLTFMNKDVLGGIKMGNVEKRMIKTTDGKDMLTWVIYPPDFDPTKKYPTLLYCQGGPQSTVSQFFSYRWNFQLMAANGYIIVAPNRRGLPSFGQEWNDQISGDWGGQNMRDYLSAIDELAKEPFVDETNLGVVGASYGGYSAFFLAGIHEKRFKTFVAHCGLFNLESFYATTEEMFFADWDLGGPFWGEKRSKSYDLFSPHKFVHKWDSPILIIHNDKDFRVPLSEGMQAFNAAQMLGLPSRFVSFPDENHWMLRPQNSILWQREFFGWLDKWLK